VIVATHVDTDQRSDEVGKGWLQVQGCNGGLGGSIPPHRTLVAGDDESQCPGSRVDCHIAVHHNHRHTAAAADMHTVNSL
jgi:hypothetical protein